MHLLHGEIAQKALQINYEWYLYMFTTQITAKILLTYVYVCLCIYTSARLTKVAQQVRKKNYIVLNTVMSWCTRKIFG